MRILGFGRKQGIHHKLALYVEGLISDIMADPDLTWEASLDDIWKRKKLVIVSYDYMPIIHEFPSLLWTSVQQRWGNVQNASDLKRYLAPAGRNFLM